MVLHLLISVIFAYVQDFNDLVLTGPYRAISSDGEGFAIRVDPPRSELDQDDDDENLWELKFSADDNDKIGRAHV